MDSWWYRMDICDTFWVRQHYKYNYHKNNTNSEDSLECNTWIETGGQMKIQVLQERKWNKDIEDAWIMDIDIIDEYNDDESNM